MTSYTHTPISPSVLKYLSSASLTGLSNLLTEKLNTYNSKIRDLDSRIKLLSKKNSVSNKNTYTVGPVATELNALEVAEENGIPISELYENPPNETLNLEDLRNAVLGQIPQQSFKDDNLLGSNELKAAQNEKSSITAAALLVLDDIDKITQTLTNRTEGLEEEPKINYTVFDTVQLDPEDLKSITDHQNFIATKLVRPLKDNKAALKAIEAQKLGQSDDDTLEPFEINLLGPPLSTEGKFILSEKGLYYDSRNGGIPEVVADQLLFDSWKLNYAPNKGGKGIAYDKFDLLEYSNTVFSKEYEETNQIVETLYEIDKVLQNIEQDKAKHINIVSGQITDMVVSGLSVSSAIVQNYHRSIAAINEAYDLKLFKRRKQLQLAGLFGNFILTDNSFPLGKNNILLEVEDYKAKQLLSILEPSTTWQITEDYKYAYLLQNEIEKIFEILSIIPINDFSYLKGTGLIPTIDSQRKTLLQSGDVRDVILPIKPKFVKTLKQNTLYISDFAITKDGIGSFLHTSGTTHVSSVVPFIKSITDDITYDGLVLLYNFLDGKITSPSGTEYDLTNEAKTSIGLNGKLVSPTITQVFPSGLGLAYFGGTLYDPEQSENPEPWYDNLDKGSYVRVPNNIKDGELFLNSSPVLDLTYNSKGFSLDSWVYIPTLLTGMSDTHRYRLMFGNENTGPGKQEGDTGLITAKRVRNEMDTFKEVDPIKTHGMLVGFAINPSKQGTSYQSSDLVLGIWPTVSQNSPDGKWGPSVALAEKVIGNDPLTATRTLLGMQISHSTQTASGKSILSVSGQVCHISISFDYHSDSIKVYLDSELLSSSAISVCFNTNPGEPLQIPTAASYNATNPYITSLGVKNTNKFAESLHEGLTTPINGLPLFTPWIIGGGFTDTVKRDIVVERTLGNLTPLGFLGSNTNNSHWTGSLDAYGSIPGQHLPGLGGDTYSGVNRKIPKSGLNGFMGSVKFYNKPLNTNEVIANFNAQKAFFKNIKL